MLIEKPDVLYFLLLLIIPILVHLFQLRKFKKTSFTNVAFLHQIQLRSRKSSQLKKWLILITRLLSLFFLILAFSKPFIPTTDEAMQEYEIVIYLDNSFSMELPGNQLSLLEEAKQNLWENLQDDQEFSLITNTKTWKNITKKDIKQEFFSIDFTPTPLPYKTILLKSQNSFKKKNTNRRLFMITDALNFKEELRLDTFEGIDLDLILKQPASLSNYAIASAELNTNNSVSMLKINLSSYESKEEDLTVSLYDSETLISKTKANFKGKKSAQVEFELSNDQFSKGRVEIEPDGVSYDNTLYFSLNKNKKIKIANLHESESKTSFLNSIFQDIRFDYNSYAIVNFDYSLLNDTNLLILNEIENINPILLSQVKSFIDGGGKLIIIPSKNTEPGDYLEILGLQLYNSPVFGSYDITTINFQHPLFKNVFSEQISNFDYPSTSQFIEVNNDFNAILEFSNAKPFFAENGRVYCFASPLNPEITNFTNSPLIVPVFYNIALESSPNPQLYSIIGEDQLLNIKANLGKDEILKLVSENKQMIPQQTKVGKFIQINTKYQPKESGVYQLNQQDSTLLHLSFNYNRSESNFSPLNSSDLEVKSFNTIAEAFNSFAEDQKILELWTWMLIFASGFFIVELLILRFLK
ncbi:BatA domain-containing protein [Psychroflexus tropicus]|uniref:BatA domain-containing protein n=1 Tax=Psychroflexus tropicus TaxID=197345 RepID=UPI00036E54A1|nr:BatA domain-containing protein [Psychroflexus tropicus]